MLQRKHTRIAKAVVGKLFDWLGAVQTVQGVPETAAAIWTWGARGAVIVTAVYVWLADLPWPVRVPAALGVFGLGGFLVLVATAIYISVAQARLPVRTESKSSALPDLEVAIGGVASGLASLPKPGAPLGPRQIATWATVVNRRRKVSLGFALRNPETGMTARLAQELDLTLYGSDSPTAGLPFKYIFEPLLMGPGEERQGNLIFMLHDLSHGPQPFTVLTITDSLSGESHDIDLTRVTPLPAASARHGTVRHLQGKSLRLAGDEQKEAGGSNLEDLPFCCRLQRSSAHRRAVGLGHSHPCSLSPGRDTASISDRACPELESCCPWHARIVARM